MTAQKHTPGIVSRLPVHHGDGYSWGGDLLVTFGDQSVNLGCGRGAEKLATLLAAAPDMLEVAKRILERGYVSASIIEERDDHNALVAAIAKAEGQS